MTAATRTRQPTNWNFHNLESGFEREGPLRAYWEVLLDPISGAYTPAEIDAGGLLEQWAREVRRERPDDLIPISRFVECAGQLKFERLPFQFQHPSTAPRKDFLSFYTWPVDSKSGDRLNWFTVPVVDKLWNANRGDTGGFLQEASGWKPAVLQPYVYLPALLSAAGKATLRRTAVKVV